MGKHGPCCHCGVTSTPLWRNGPPEKPVLCNACGSRWRTKGSLVNYTPLHSRAEPNDFEDYRVTKVKKVSIKPKEANVFKRKFDNGISEFGMVPPDYNTGFIKRFEENTSNRSSSGSAISNSESCVNADASDLTGPSQPNAWNKIVPSRKRTCVIRPNPKPSPVEKLTKDLYTIWHEQQSSCLSGSSEENVLLETENSMASLGFGYGSVLIRSIARDEESEASSLPIYQKQNIVNSRPMAFKEDPGVNLLRKGDANINKPPNQGSEIQRDKDQFEKLQILGHHNSPLCHIDLQDVLNFDEFASLLTYNEQQQLLKFLPSVDTVEVPFSLKSMFGSAQFKENLLSFQKLLVEGVFDSSLAGVSVDDCRILKKLILGNLKKSKWVKQYNIFKDFKGKNRVDEPEVAGTLKAITATDHSATTKKSQDGPYKKLQAKVRMKNPTSIIMKSTYNQKELIDYDENFLGAKRVFSSENYNGSLVLDSFRFGEESCDQDLLLDVPPSNISFPQAELLLSTSSFGAQASTSSVVQYT